MHKGTLLGRGRTAEIYAWGDGEVIKLFRSFVPEDWVQHEARIGRIVMEAGLAAPRIGAPIEVDGRRGLIYERIDGPTLLQSVLRQPWTLPRAARTFATLHADMHNCHRPQLPAQRTQLRHSIQRAPGLPEATKAKILHRMEGLPDGDAVCHGDYHPDNILMAAQGPVIIDWVAANAGAPAVDVARTTLLLLGASLPPGLNSAQAAILQGIRQLYHALYLRTYRRLRRLARREIEIWLPILAAARLSEQIPEEEALLYARVQRAFGP